MKNKLFYILVAILISFSFINDVFADDAFEYTVNISFDDDNIVTSTEVVRDSEVSVYVSLKSDANIDSCLFDIKLDSDIEFVSLEKLNGWIVRDEGIGQNGIIVESSSFTSLGQLSDGLNILLLKYKVKGNGKLEITSNSYCSNGSIDTYANEKVINFTTRELSDDYTLKGIKINGVDFESYNPNGNNFLIPLDKPNFSLEYETTNPDYQDDVVVKFNDNVVTNLNNIIWSDSSGQNSASLEIVVHGGKTYNFSVNYEAKELDNTLKSLKINGSVVNLQDGIFNYTVKVASNVTSIDVEAILNDSVNFKIEEPFDNGKLTNNCSGSTCSFQIEIVPVDDKSGGSSLSYIIEVVKESSGGSSSQSSSKPSSGSKPTTGDVEKNPQTGDISMFFMALILISSLIGSVFLYQKNMEGYK